jgi:hypothetical protein
MTTTWNNDQTCHTCGRDLDQHDFRENEGWLCQFGNVDIVEFYVPNPTLRRLYTVEFTKESTR